jgi:hypothetical protein
MPAGEGEHNQRDGYSDGNGAQHVRLLLLSVAGRRTETPSRPLSYLCACFMRRAGTDPTRNCNEQLRLRLNLLGVVEGWLPSRLSLRLRQASRRGSCQATLLGSLDAIDRGVELLKLRLGAFDHLVEVCA